MDGLFLTSRRHWWEQVNSTVIEFHLSNTSGSRRVRTRIARLADRDSNDCAISPPPLVSEIVKCREGNNSIHLMYIFLRFLLPYLAFHNIQTVFLPSFPPVFPLSSRASFPCRFLFLVPHLSFTSLTILSRFLRNSLFYRI